MGAADMHGTEKDATARGLAVALYGVVTVLMLIQQPGATTYDTRAELTERPAAFLAGAFTLWHPDSSMGEFQNQAYGYLFPQGSWFWLTDVLGVPGWVSQRLWTALLLVIACEGARRVARSAGLPDAVALVAGVAYAAAPRMLGTVAVQTGESLPGAVMPWLVLAVLLHLRGRLSLWRTVLLSGAAVVCMGGVNAVETVGCLPLAIILVGWGVRRRLTTWRFAGAWTGAVVAACLWWALPLSVLARYAPPFYEYVESARDTTAAVGWSEAARGDSSWIAYLLVGDRPWWPAAYHLATDPLLVVVAAVIAAIGLVGLTRLESDLARPLLLAVMVGLGCLTVAHGGPAGTPVADTVRGLLDGGLQAFRNVHKIDPVVRLPLAIGFGAAVSAVVGWCVERAPSLVQARPLLVLAPLVGVLVLGQPYLLADARTPGWTRIDPAWRDARDYLAEHGAATGQAGRALVVPGSNFALEDWGWTIDEPLAILGGVNMVSRTQVPLVPGQSIRYLSGLDQLISSGRADDALPEQLARAGITYVVLRRDLDRDLTGSPHPGGAAVSLARGGLDRVASFGDDGEEGGPTVEIFAVPEREPFVRATSVTDVVTVRGAPESVLDLESAGLVGASQPTVLEGEPGWDGPPAVVTDSDQRRERAFGTVDEAVSSVMTADEPWRTDRAVHDYPGVPGSPQVVARYDGLSSVTASSAQGYADNFGPVATQSGPYAAIDGNLDTRWISSSATDPDHQWLRLSFSAPRAVHEITVTPVADDPAVVPARELEVVAGDQHVRVPVNASGAPAVVTLDGSEVGSVEVRVVAAATAADAGRVGLREVQVDGLDPRRRLVLPGEVPADAAWLFHSVPGRRACYVSLGVPDCQVTRIRAPEEQGGLRRVLTLEGRQRVGLSGEVVARSTPAAARLLDVLQHRPPVTATSFFGEDVKVAPRFAYDGQATTAWLSDDADVFPTLTFRWRHPHRIAGLTVGTGGGEATPTAAVVSSASVLQRVSLVPGVEARLRPFRTQELQVRFIKAPDERHVAVPELTLDGVDVTRPFLADAPTGAVCGLGPRIVVDGRSVATRVSGTLADVVNGSPLELRACRVRGGDPRPVRLSAGEHRIRTVSTAEYDVVQLTGSPRDEPPAAVGTRSVDVTAWGDAERTVDVGEGPAAVLSLPENFNAGWAAEVDGERLQPVRVDGWQQGWVLPAGGAVTVELDYGPARTYAVLLPLGLGVSGCVLLGGLVALAVGLIRRRSGEPPGPWPAPVDAGPVTALVVIAGSIALLGWPATAALAVSGAVAWRGGRLVGWWVVVAAGGLVVLSGALDALGAAPATGDVAAAIGCGAVVGVVVGRRTPRGESS